MKRIKFFIWSWKMMNKMGENFQSKFIFSFCVAFPVNGPQLMNCPPVPDLILKEKWGKTHIEMGGKE
jgi:hypothetical protein